MIEVCILKRLYELSENHITHTHFTERKVIFLCVFVICETEKFLSFIPPTHAERFNKILFTSTGCYNVFLNNSCEFFSVKTFIFVQCFFEIKVCGKLKYNFILTYTCPYM